jgi:tRNA(Ile)-lysidine synthase TilS/MesJ
MHLCREHFEADVNRKIRETLRRTGLFGRRAKVLVGLDGGRNSATLAYVLKNLFARRKDIDLMAMVIDDGEKRSRAIEDALLIAEGLEMPAAIKRLRIPEDEDTAMSRLTRKRQLFCDAAHDCGGNIIATGEDLDDEALEIFVRYLQGETEKENESFEALREPGAGELNWIKPLSRVFKKEVRLYAMGRNLGNRGDETPCSDPLRRAAKRQLSLFECRHPGTCYSLLSGWERSFSQEVEGKAFK